MITREYIEGLNKEQRINEIEKFLKVNDINHIFLNNKETLLLIAIDLEDNEIIKYLISKGVDVNGSRKAYCYPLEKACQVGNFEIIKMLDSTRKLKYNRKYDQSLIIAASFNQEVDICRFLLEKGIDIDKIGYQGLNALHWALQNQNCELIKLLIQFGANLDIVNDADQTALYQAAADNNLEEVQLLLSAGADTETGRTAPLIIAALLHNYEVVKMLLENGANINSKDSDGRTALFYAYVKMDQELIDFLNENGANECTADNQGIEIKQLKNETIRRDLFEELYG